MKTLLPLVITSALVAISACNKSKSSPVPATPAVVPQTQAFAPTPISPAVAPSKGNGGGTPAAASSAGTTATPPVVPAATAGTPSLGVHAHPPTAAAPTPPAAAASAGLNNLWLDTEADPNAPFPSTIYTCKGTAIVNEAKMQIALGYYCTFNYATQGFQPGWTVVDIEYIGALTSEAGNEFDFTNSAVGCDSSLANQALYTGYTMTTSNGTPLLNLSTGSAPEYLAHWANSPQIGGLAVGCIDQNTGTFHQNDQLKTALSAMMVY